jgi:NAD-dependent deacetylase
MMQGEGTKAQIVEVARRLRAARRVLVFTGAGISAESGVPTFRDALSGLWARFQPEELATRDAFCRDPATVWRWYAWRRELVGRAEPNAGHRALVELEGMVPEFLLATQNVDGLHIRAGSRQVVELHGNLFRTKRFGDGCVVDSWDDHAECPPRCPRTGDLLRPDVVWFGESLPPVALDEALHAARRADVCLSVGTSSVVYPAAGIPIAARDAGAFLVEVNPEPTPLSHRAQVTIRELAGTALPQIVACMHQLG